MNTVESLRGLIDIQLLCNAFWVRAARLQGRRHPAIDQYIIDALISATPGVNAVADRLLTVVQMGEAVRQAIVEIAGDTSGSLPEAARFVLTDEVLRQVQNGAEVRLFTGAGGPERREILSGLKQLAQAAAQSSSLDAFDDKALHAMTDGLAALAGVPGLGLSLDTALEAAGKHLDAAKTVRFGTPDKTAPQPVLVNSPCIVVSGADFQVLEDVLVQTFQRGISVYTHGALAVAHRYPGFRQFEHLTGHVAVLPDQAVVVLCLGFEAASLKTSSARLFTTGLLALPGVTHVADKAYREVISGVLNDK